MTAKSKTLKSRARVVEEAKATPKSRMPKTSDMAAAEKEFEAENAGRKFSELPTRKRNALAKDQMFHREFAALSNAIKGK